MNKQRPGCVFGNSYSRRFEKFPGYLQQSSPFLCYRLRTRANTKKNSVTGVFLEFYHKPKRSSSFRLFYPANIYLFKVNNRNTRKRCETCSKLTIKTPERRQWRCSGVFIVNFERILLFFLVFLLLTLNKCISTEAHSESSLISKMKLFCENSYRLKAATHLAKKNSILDVRLISECTSGLKRTKMFK